MARSINPCPNGLMSPPGGFPARLWVGSTDMLEGIIPPHRENVDIVAKTEAGTADLHAAIFAMPQTVGASDGESIDQVDLEGLGVTEQTLTLELPTDTAPAAYVLRIWADALTAEVPDGEDRDQDGSATDEPTIPVGVSIVSVTLS